MSGPWRRPYLSIAPRLGRDIRLRHQRLTSDYALLYRATFQPSRPTSSTCDSDILMSPKCVLRLHDCTQPRLRGAHVRALTYARPRGHAHKPQHDAHFTRVPFPTTGSLVVDRDSSKLPNPYPGTLESVLCILCTRSLLRSRTVEPAGVGSLNLKGHFINSNCKLRKPHLVLMIAQA